MLFSSQIFIISKVFCFFKVFSYIIWSFAISYTIAPFPEIKYLLLFISFAIVFIESIGLPDAIITSIPFSCALSIASFVFCVTTPYWFSIVPSKSIATNLFIFLFSFLAHVRSLFFRAKLHTRDRFFSVQNCTREIAFFPCIHPKSLFFRAIYRKKQDRMRKKKQKFPVYFSFKLYIISLEKAIVFSKQ